MLWLDTIYVGAEYSVFIIYSMSKLKALDQLLVFGDKLSMSTSAKDQNLIAP